MTQGYEISLVLSNLTQIVSSLLERLITLKKIMGFNIAGLVINKNYDKSIKRLGDDIKWGIEIIEEVDFETASSIWTPEGEFRLHFTDKATMIFFPHDWVSDQSKSKSADTLNYAYSATSMAFHLDLFKSGNLVRSIMEYNDKRQLEKVNFPKSDTT